MTVKASLVLGHNGSIDPEGGFWLGSVTPRSHHAQFVMILLFTYIIHFPQLMLLYGIIVIYRDCMTNNNIIYFVCP